MEKKKCILITGVAGLLGSKMADYISEYHKEYNIVGIDNLFGGYVENINKDVMFYKRDLALDDIDDIFKEHDIEYVFHFAAYAAEGLSPFMRRFNWNNNSVSTANIINCCIEYGVKRLVYTSSMSIYGHGDMKHNRFDENDTPLSN
jgi:UDP-glucose 4-epimerase